MARGVAASKEFLDIHILIQEYMVSLEHQRIQKLYPNITFETKFEPGPLYIYCSSVHIKKCLMNLAVNAAEAITNSGSITISTAKIRDDGPVSEKTKMPGEQVVLKVTDTGQGIAPEDLEHIFEPFYTKKKMGRSGTGLGLSVVWNTMQDHNGNIRVGNNTIGTTFELVFPAAGEKRDDQDTETIDHIDLQGKGETILVVDDEAQQRYIAATILEKFGYKVEVASSGEFAVAVIEKRGVDLVLLDMVMDPGISGRQTYEEMIKVRPGQKAVVVSGFAEDEDVKRVISLGINHFVKKQIGRAHV